MSNPPTSSPQRMLCASRNPERARGFVRRPRLGWWKRHRLGRFEGREDRRKFFDRFRNRQRFRFDRGHMDGLGNGPCARPFRRQPLQAAGANFELLEHNVGGVALEVRGFEKGAHLALGDADAVQVVRAPAVEFEVARQALAVVGFGVGAARGAGAERARRADNAVVSSEQGIDDRGGEQPEQVADDRDDDDTDQEAAEQFHEGARRELPTPTPAERNYSQSFTHAFTPPPARVDPTEVSHTSQAATACVSPASGSRVGMNSWPT